MPSAFTPPKLLKGALIEFSKRFIGSTPNIIVFQFNPEMMTRKLEPWYSEPKNGQGAGGREPVNAQPHDPPETFDLVLEFDALDEIDNPADQVNAIVNGVSARIAALEMLLYPDDDGNSLTGSGAAQLAGTASGTSASKSGGTSTAVPRAKVPDLLFCYGPSRIVPVRITSFSVEEQAYSALLSPIRAKVSLGMKILQPRNLPLSNEQATDLLKVTYRTYITTKKVLAASNLVSQVDSILGMLPI